jgi:glycosyltransferase involved in cell wall biosynthesis
VRILLGARSTNDYWQQIALALHDAGALGEYRTGYVEGAGGPVVRFLRKVVRRIAPRWDARLTGRRVTTVPTGAVNSQTAWDLARMTAVGLGAGPLLEDQIFDSGERRFDAGCASRLASGGYDGFIGAEYGSLASLEAARHAGTTSVVTFVSAHHAFREKWVDHEYEKFPELLTEGRRRVMELGKMRDLRRDAEIQKADLVLTNSLLVSDSLEEAGVPSHRLVTVPLGCPEPMKESSRDARKGPTRFMFAGGLSLQKGIPYLLEAWKRIRPGKRAELHLYGTPYLPERCFADAGASVVFHGPVLREAVERAYGQADALVFPSLCDGFGAVVTEALAHGLPVITTPHAGSSMLIHHERNGLLVPPANVDALAEALSWCLSHPKELTAMRTAALESARQWSWRDFRMTLRRDLLSRMTPR